MGKIFQQTYKESQKFSLLPMLILIPISLGVCFMAVWQIGFGHLVGNHPTPDSVLILIAFFVCSLTIVFYFVRLETEITDQGISYRFRFGLSYGGVISWPDVAELRFIRYPYLGEGIRLYMDRNAWAYVMGNENKGVLIIRKNGKRNILLSTHQVSALKEYIKTLAPQGVQITED